uniref:F-box domain-containing protein n=1 Tax=Steinernema glaseri TaxID=37863 RepID=A0A1I7YI60_9BILA
MPRVHFMCISLNLTIILSHAFNMDSVPHAFFDAVFIQLDKWDLMFLKKISSHWSNEATIHYNERRELECYLTVDFQGNQVGIEISDYHNRTVACSALNVKHDRIKSVVLEYDSVSDHPEKPSLECFKKKFFPVLHLLAFKCLFSSVQYKVFPQDVSNIFNVLQECNQFTEIHISNSGEKCAKFVRRQIDLGNVRRLTLCNMYGDCKWPATVQASLKSLVKSPKLRELDLSHSNLTLDLAMVTSLVERFLEGYSAIKVVGKPSFPVRRLQGLDAKEQRSYKDNRTYGELFEWTRANALVKSAAGMIMIASHLRKPRKASQAVINICIPNGLEDTLKGMTVPLLH